MKQLKRTALLLLMAIFGSNVGLFAQPTITHNANSSTVNNLPLYPAGTNVTLNGTGTADNPYQIGSPEEWDAFATIVNVYGDNRKQDACGVLTADITFTKNHQQPGENSGYFFLHNTSNYCYKGTFNGNGHTITLNYNSTLVCYDGITRETWGGLFWHVQDATIKNLKVTGVIRTMYNHCGTIIQHSNSNNKLLNCEANVQIINEKPSANNYLGGLIGGNQASTNNEIQNCYAHSEYASTSENNVTNSGGMWGILKSATVKNSYAAPRAINSGFTSFYSLGFLYEGGSITTSDTYYKMPSYNGTLTSQGEAVGTKTASQIAEALNEHAKDENNQACVPWVAHNDTVYLKTFAKYVDITGWEYGSAANTPIVEGNSGNATVTYKYKVKDADDDTYTETQPTNAGNYTVKAIVSPTTGWNGWESTMDFSISPRPITVTPDEGQSKTYGEADPTLTYTVDNIVSSESLSGSLSRSDGSDVGNYAITQGNVTDANNSNYTITFTSGKTFAITQKTATLSWSATSFDYDGSAKAPTAAVSNLVSGDACDVTVSVTGDHSAIGTYIATATNLSNSNYALPDDPTTTYYIVRLLDGMSFTASKHWNSYYAAENLATPDGITAYIITGISGTTAIASSISYIPQNVGVLLYSESALSDIRARGYSGDAGTFTSNKLVGVNAATSLAAEAGYILYGDAFVLTTGGMLPANRCSLPASGPASSRGLNIDTGDGTTFINAISKDEMNDERWFDLQGQRIARPQKKGIYIRDGKKVVIK